MKQTAVEWLAKELESYGDPQFCKITWEDLDSLVNQAKEMEKNQIRDAFDFGVYDGGGIIKKYKMSGEKYYNETFKSE